MKRSYTSLKSSSAKRTKTTVDPHSLTSSAIAYFLDQSKSAFIDYLRMPPILFKHQLYALKADNRTLIDRELQDMFNDNQIRLFHSDFGTMFMATTDYQLLIERQLHDEHLSSVSMEKSRLKQRFIHDLLPKCIRLSVDRTLLETDYQMNSNDINLLVQQGLLLPKDIDQYWFSVPNLGRFVTCIEKARRTLRSMISRRTYQEISLDEFRQRELKRSQCLLGFDYHIYDLIGGNLAHLLDTPTGLVVRKGPEKI